MGAPVDTADGAPVGTADHSRAHQTHLQTLPARAKCQGPITRQTYMKHESSPDLAPPVYDGFAVLLACVRVTINVNKIKHLIWK